MITDAYGLRHAAAAPAALAAFEAAVHAVGAHRPQAAPALAEALAAEPDLVAGHALKGFACLILARAELGAPAAAALGAARDALAARDGGTGDERLLVSALGLAAAGRFGAAADLIDTGFADRPTAFLPFKLSHSLRFMVGDAAGMRRASERMLAVWSEADPAAGFLLGCHAFALEEHGDYAEAEAFGRRAVALQPEDAWGLHAVGHVHEMRGAPAAGVAWIEAARPHWSRCNNFAFHMAWHLALMRLELDEGDAALAIYDAEVRPAPTDDFRDMANAVSLLWRFERSGVSVGGRWADLAEIARRRCVDTTLVFAQLHMLVALVALGDRAAVAETLAALGARASGDCDQSRVAAEVGLPVARVIAGVGAPAGLAGLAAALPRVGGSHAQRDLFLLALAEAATRAGDLAARRSIGAARARLKAEDRLLAAVDAHARAARAA